MLPQGSISTTLPWYNTFHTMHCIIIYNLVQLRMMAILDNPHDLSVLLLERQSRVKNSMIFLNSACYAGLVHYVPDLK